eukprot:CAMPEP_0194668228 /NCGR_PEP_ID=MMETSP0295-20121207/3806_1 /TAXON_ID=39354 /ORGANISM="Heterosigma akashiwo, Strain CCMP2393" /LENGTH=234 /DNA_ID=CAMNT_0039550869 /DNA_START=34 /DNA_END=736 /DNA_ORIENTATION=+
MALVALLRGRCRPFFAPLPPPPPSQANAPAPLLGRTAAPPPVCASAGAAAQAVQVLVPGQRRLAGGGGGGGLPLSPLAEASAGGSFPSVPSEDRSTQTDEEETGVVLAERMGQTVAAMAGEIQAREAELSSLRERAEEARGLRAVLGELGGRNARLEEQLSGLARDKSQLEEELRAVQLQKLEEGLRLKEIEDRLLRNPDLQSKNALTFLRGIKKKRLARFEGRLGLLRAERAR